ncbi:MAG TPA: histidine--tRNA ligase [Acidimicrobiia bacterium]|nr:histidine--tRNA ligase [Acidimicrobiia bacterium]
MITPRTPSGVLELLPADQAAFRRMLDTIRSTYERFGFVEIETPVFEMSDVLLTKTGGETERQIYFVQSTGAMDREGLPDLALRFDLTVPLARYVAEHQNDLAFPFKRHQIQRVYRGERPQKGRFREFYQCDIDVIGRDTLSLRHDAEVPAVIHDVFSRIGIGPFTIRINHRGLMTGLLAQEGVAEAELRASVLREIDKLDKRPAQEVGESLLRLGLEQGTAARLLDLVTRRVSGSAAAIDILHGLDASDDRVRRGVADLTVVFEGLADLGVPDDRYALDLGVARGLEYYTGTVYETTLDEHPEIGSVCSGGRYEDLAGLYTKARLPGVGISIGLTRLFWQLREAGLIGPVDTSVQAYVTVMDVGGVGAALRLATSLRSAGINTDVAPEPDRLGRQLKHADRLGARFALIMGEEERAAGTVTLKDLRTGEQVVLPADGEELTSRIQAGVT